MKQNILLSTVLCTLIVLQLTTTTAAQWKSCFDDSCPIKQIKFSSKSDYKCVKGPRTCGLASDPGLDDGQIFVLQVESGDVERPMEIDWVKDTLQVLFTCGPVVKTAAHNYVYPKINENSIYIDNKEYCFWSLDMNNVSFPYELIDPPQYYISDSGYQIYYSLNQTVPVPAANYSQLPKSVEPFVDGYQYKAVGSEKYLLVARQANKSTDFLLKVNGETPRFVEVNLKSYISIDVECNFEKWMVTAYQKMDEAKKNLWDKIHDVKIDGNECKWSLPDYFDDILGQVKLTETAYELQIMENNMFVYFDEDNFRMATPTSASSSLTIAKSLFIILLSMCLVL